jgi:hypothetical protein
MEPPTFSPSNLTRISALPGLVMWFSLIRGVFPIASRMVSQIIKALVLPSFGCWLLLYNKQGMWSIFSMPGNEKCPNGNIFPFGKTTVDKRISEMISWMQNQ